MIPTNARSFVHVTMVIFDTKDEAQTRRAYDTSKLLVREAAKHGYGEYRAHLDFMDLASEQYSFNNHAYRRFVETIEAPRSIRTGSSRRASRGSGRRRCAGGDSQLNASLTGREADPDQAIAAGEEFFACARIVHVRRGSGDRARGTKSR